VKKDRPNIEVTVYTLPDHIGLASKHGILTVPALLIKGKSFWDILSKQEIISALDAPT
jgi:hypothetical protein